MATRKVKKGEAWRPDSADDHNVKARAADAYRRGEVFIPDREHPTDPCRVWIRNTSGAARSQFQCLELDDGVVLNEIKAHKLYFDGVACTGKEIPFAVLLQPAPNNRGFRRGQVAGICPALVNVGNTAHTRAYLPSGAYVLKSSKSGPVAIVQQPGSTGEQLCVILFDGGIHGQIRRGCLAENHPGCGVVFDLKLGTHNPATDDWDYEASASAKGIDHWYSADGPYPNAGATGWFIAKPSDTYGTLWHGWDISCTEDSCGGCGA